MTEQHLMMCVDGTGGESLFECTVDGCGRRLVFDHIGARLVVVHPGLHAVPHHGSTGLVGMTGTID